MNLLYSISIRLFSLILKLAAPFNMKAKQICMGRRQTFRLLSDRIKNGDRIIWVHCASLGEFEQGRPLIEAIKKQYLTYKILLTFFSPSGYEIRKNYDLADCICYLPSDTKANAKKMIDMAKPEIVFFVKYEFWNNYLHEFKKRNIPLYLVSAIFRENQQFFKKTTGGKWYREMLFCFSHFFVQDENSVLLLKNIGINNVTRAGDTRFDRVAEIAKNGKNMPLIEKFKGNNLLVVVGSSWRPDEELIADYIINHPEIKFVIAPHETKRANVDRLINLLKTSIICYTEANEETVINKQVMVVDTIGILSSIYRYADLAYIGGGFGVGIHNTLEAAIFGMPIVFGPNFHRFNEATTMVKLGVAFPVNSKDELNTALNQMLFNKEKRENVVRECAIFTNQNLGATQMILSKVFNKE